MQVAAHVTGKNSCKRIKARCIVGGTINLVESVVTSRRSVDSYTSREQFAVPPSPRSLKIEGRRSRRAIQRYFARVDSLSLSLFLSKTPSCKSTLLKNTMANGAGDVQFEGERTLDRNVCFKS